MRAVYAKRKLVFWIGMLLCLPAFCYILISLFKYIFNLPFLFSAFAFFMESWGVNETLGFTINALILFGPFIALLLNLAVVLPFRLYPNRWQLKWFAGKSGSKWLIVLLSSFIFFTLFIYAIGDHCNCLSNEFKMMKNEGNRTLDFWPYLFTHISWMY